MRRRSALAGLAVAALSAASLVAGAVAGDGRAGHADAAVRVWTIHYRAHNGVRRAATVLLPAWYGPHSSERRPLPLVISPHGRGLTGRQNAALWHDLPAAGSFAVISPDGQGRRLTRYSWGSAGQIEDLARMPTILARTLPWVSIEREQIYAFGGSMGGQETLLLAARHPRLLAGAAVFDSVADLGLQYRSFTKLRCSRRCRTVWRGPLGEGLQSLARQEVGGAPWRRPAAYARRSPITYARALAFSCVPLQIWWSLSDRVVRDQRRQSGRLYTSIKRLNDDAPIEAFVGSWVHTAEMRADRRLPVALAAFGLLPPPTNWPEPRYLPPPDYCASTR